MYINFFQIENPHFNKDGLLQDYCDGDNFKTHPLFSIKPTALQIMFYYDDLETCNVLGSRVNKHKIGTVQILYWQCPSTVGLNLLIICLGAFYYTLGNIRPLYRSSLKAIQLLCLCTTSIIKEYGINAVLQPFIADLNKLEQVFIYLVIQMHPVLYAEVHN